MPSWRWSSVDITPAINQYGRNSLTWSLERDPEPGPLKKAEAEEMSWERIQLYRDVLVERRVARFMLTGPLHDEDGRVKDPIGMHWTLWLHTAQREHVGSYHIYPCGVSHPYTGSASATMGSNQFDSARNGYAAAAAPNSSGQPSNAVRPPGATSSTATDDGWIVVDRRRTTSAARQQPQPQSMPPQNLPQQPQSRPRNSLSINVPNVESQRSFPELKKAAETPATPKTPSRPTIAAPPGSRSTSKKKRVSGVFGGLRKHCTSAIFSELDRADKRGDDGNNGW